MHSRRRALALLPLLAVAAGCGGGSTAPPATTAGPPPRRAVLQRYLDAMGPRQERFRSLSERVVAAITDVDEAKPGPTWTTAAAKLDPVVRGFGDLAGAVASVQPPKPLADVHERYAEAVSSFSTYVYAVENALRAKVPNLLAIAANQDLTAVKQARTDWLAAVERYAQRIGVTPPEWLIPSPAG